MEHQIELTAESLWSEVSGRLRGALNDTTYGTWFHEASGLELSKDRFVLGVPNDFTRDWIEGHFLGLIGAAVRDVTGAERPVELRVSDVVASQTSQSSLLPRRQATRRPRCCAMGSKSRSSWRSVWSRSMQ